MGYLVAVLIGALLSLDAGDTFASEHKQKEGLWIEYEYSERSIENRHCNLHFSLSNLTKTEFSNIEIRGYIELLDAKKVSLYFGEPNYDKYNECSAPGSLDTSLSHAAGLIEIAACHA